MFLNHCAAFEYVKKLLVRKGYRIRMLHKLNKGRHLLIETVYGERYQYFYVIFKHTFLHSFNYLFKDFVEKYPNLEGHGETINIENLEYARIREATLLFVYPDMKVYGIDSRYVYKFVHEHNLIRTQERRNEYKIEYANGQVEVINEQTASFPVKLLVRYD